TLAAGASPENVRVGPGEAVRIMTGAPMPAGVDAVVMVELTHTEGDVVVIDHHATAGDHIRAAGDDLKPGDVVVDPGTVLGPAHLGVLASLGYQRVPVFPRPRVGVLSTGDELVDGPQDLRPGQIRDSNRPTLLALVRQSVFIPVDLGLAHDDEAVITTAVEHGLETCDALVTSGGVSVGDFDYMKAVLDRLGSMNWWQVAIRPARLAPDGRAPAGVPPAGRRHGGRAHPAPRRRQAPPRPRSGRRRRRRALAGAPGRRPGLPPARGHGRGQRVGPGARRRGRRRGRRGQGHGALGRRPLLRTVVHL